MASKKDDDIPWLCKAFARQRSLECFQALYDLVTGSIHEKDGSLTPIVGLKQSDRLRAIELLLAYGVGRPVQEFSIDATISTTTQFIDQPTPLSREEWIKTYQRKLIASAPTGRPSTEDPN